MKTQMNKKLLWKTMMKKLGVNILMKTMYENYDNKL